MSAAPTITDTTRSCAKLSQPSAKATGTLRSAAKRTPSMAIITGRLRRNSPHGPSGTATAAPTASPAAASTDTSAGPASRTRIAISGNASNASQVPIALTAYAAHSHSNCRPSDLDFIRGMKASAAVGASAAGAEPGAAASGQAADAVDDQLHSDRAQQQPEHARQELHECLRHHPAHA